MHENFPRSLVQRILTHSCFQGRRKCPVSAGHVVIPSDITLLMRKEGNVDIRQETSSVLHALLRAVLKIENIMALIIHQILKNCYLNIGKKCN